MSIVAFTAVALALGTWAGFRLGAASANLDHDLRSYLLATIPSEPSACAACDPGAADTRGPRRIPPAGAGPTQAPGATGFGVNN